MKGPLLFLPLPLFFLPFPCSLSSSSAPLPLRLSVPSSPFYSTLSHPPSAPSLPFFLARCSHLLGHLILGSRIQSLDPVEPLSRHPSAESLVGGLAGLDLGTCCSWCCGLKQDLPRSCPWFHLGCAHCHHDHISSISSDSALGWGLCVTAGALFS